MLFKSMGGYEADGETDGNLRDKSNVLRNLEQVIKGVWQKKEEMNRPSLHDGNHKD